MEIDSECGRKQNLSGWMGRIALTQEVEMNDEIMSNCFNADEG